MSEQELPREWSPGDSPILPEVDPSWYLPGSQPLDPPRWVDGPRHCGDESCPGCNRVFGKVARLDDHRPFDVGTFTRCYGCGTNEGVVKHVGEGGFVWGCMSCGHPEDQ